MTVASTKQPVVALMAKDHPLALRGRAVSLADISSYPIALMHKSFGLGQIAHLLAQSQQQLKPAVIQRSSQRRIPTRHLNS